ncbi:hypothetical protein FACS1894219_03220 [Clostridia bacterium]|nr:hypothetical protein FACS1894219_03220 [Clostridia bacterium]
MKKSIAKRFMACFMAAAMASSMTAFVSAADSAPAEEKERVLLTKAGVSEVDVTYTPERGTVEIYLLKPVKNLRTKVQISLTSNKDAKAAYNYDINPDGNPELFPLQLGDGEYAIKVLIQSAKEPAKWAVAQTANYTLKLEDDKAPFLNANQFVNYNNDSKVVIKAKDLTKKAKTDLERVDAIFNYVIGALEYDTKKATTVQTGYIPDINAVIDSKKGICFDYAVVFAAMLRSVDIPCKLIMGYVQNNGQAIYHAWNEFYLKDKGGWFKVNEMKYNVESKTFERIDPTLVSSNKNATKNTFQFIGDGTNYTFDKQY